MKLSRRERHLSVQLGVARSNAWALQEDCMLEAHGLNSVALFARVEGIRQQRVEVGDGAPSNEDEK